MLPTATLAMPTLTSVATTAAQAQADASGAATATAAANLNSKNQANIINQTALNVDTDAVNGQLQGMSHLHYPQ